ncbi:MAG: recombination regulator RecX [Oscillospiraceae bacterium]|nr:recombination regulator RecX [Oscillospiraceae bacterium]
MEDLYKAAKKKALGLLAAKDYSEHDLKQKLLKNYEENICARVIESMHEFGFIDDLKYARSLCRHLIHNKKYGRKLVFFELKKHGISREFCDTALSEYQADDYKAAIAEFLKKRAKNLPTQQIKTEAQQKELRRTIDALIRRGHEYDDIRRQLTIDS